MPIGWRDLVLANVQIQGAARDTQNAIATLVTEFRRADIDHARELLEAANDGPAAKAER